MDPDELKVNTTFIAEKVEQTKKLFKPKNVTLGEMNPL